MILEFIRPFRHYSQGQQIDCPDGQADVFLQRGFAKRVVDVDEEKEKKSSDRKKTEGRPK